MVNIFQKLYLCPRLDFGFYLIQKRNKEKMQNMKNRSYLSGFILFIWIIFYVNNTMFWHTHQVAENTNISHSHFFLKTSNKKNSNCPIEKHHHSDNEYGLISLFNSCSVSDTHIETLVEKPIVVCLRIIHVFDKVPFVTYTPAFDLFARPPPTH